MSDERREDYESWMRCLDVELAAGTISQERYAADAEFYRQRLGQTDAPRGRDGSSVSEPSRRPLWPHVLAGCVALVIVTSLLGLFASGAVVVLVGVLAGVAGMLASAWRADRRALR